MYLVTLGGQEHRLLDVRMVPVHSQHFQLKRASSTDAQWLSRLLNELSRPFATRVRLREDNSMALESIRECS
jgi:poly-gamma-glutamate synthesis protein (capsule biosynthesis protein)